MPQISAYGAIAGANLKRANIVDRDIPFSVDSTYGWASGTLRILYDENSGALSVQIINGSMTVANAGDYLEHGYLRFRFTFQGAVFPLQKHGTTGSNSIAYAPDMLSDVVPDYDTSVTLHINIVISSEGGGGGYISEGNSYIVL